MAKLGGWVAKYVAKLRGMGCLVGSSPACYGSLLGSNPGIHQQPKMGDISKRGGQHTLAR